MTKFNQKIYEQRWTHNQTEEKMSYNLQTWGHEVDVLHTTYKMCKLHSYFEFTNRQLINGVKYWMDVVRTTPMLFWICCMVSCTSLSVLTSSILEKIPLNMAPKSSLATELSLYKWKEAIACICVHRQSVMESFFIKILWHPQT